MRVFNPIDYIEKYITNNKQERTHAEVFFEFLSTQVFDNDVLDADDFSLLNENDLIRSLEYYIERNQITSKQTAGAYVGYLKKIFGNLENDYKIQNDVYVNGDFVRSFYLTVEKTTSKLNSRVNKDMATDEEYRELIEKIESAEQKYSYDTAVSEIDSQIDIYIEKCEEYDLKRQINKRERVPEEPTILFRLIMSICATRMVVECGLRNSSIILINISDIDLDNGVIKRGKYSFPLSDDLQKDLYEYIRIRQYLLAKLEKNQEKLFIKCNGEAIESTSASDKLFGRVMGEESSKESSPYAYRCIERMIRAGFSLSVIREITGYSDTVYKNLCGFIESEQSIQQKIVEFVLPRNAEKTWKKHYINCPICGKEIKAVSQNLVLIKKDNDEILYLYCRECGEKEKAKFGGTPNE